MATASQATAEDATPGAKASGASLMATLLLVLVVTLLAAAAGGVQGIVAFQRASATIAEWQAKADAKRDGEIVVPASLGAPSSLRELMPVVTNLAAPADVWVRIEASVLLGAMPTPDTEIDLREYAADILAFMRTVSLPQLQGASGLQNLRQDLSERLSIRSKGKIRDLIIHALVIQ